MTTVKNIVSRIEEFAPTYLAEDWDPIGLAFGSNDKKVKKMMVALDLDAHTLKEAKEKNVDFIFTHHPPIFSSLNTLNEHNYRRKEYIELIQADISLYAAHTNVDAAEDGMNDWLANELGLVGPYDVIDESYQSVYKLLVVYTPVKQAEILRHSLHQLGLGEVGDYQNVSYTTEGIGRFEPKGSATPYIGEANIEEEVEEQKIEMLVPEELTSKTIQLIHEIHPYEEPVFHLININKKEQEFGIGRIGTLKDSITISELSERIKETFSVPSLRIANVDLEQQVKNIAILGGSGEGYYKKALAKGADLYITGDISYHGAQDMIRDGLPFIDPGHFIEKIFVDKMTEKLSSWNKSEKWDIEIIPSTTQKDVFFFN